MNNKKLLIAMLTSLFASTVWGQSKGELKEMVATMINMNGHLCAKVVDITPLKVRKNVYEVECIEYRGGKGRKSYVFDASKGTAWER